MKQKLDIYKWLMPLAGLLAVACGHDDLVGPDVYEEQPPAPYVELRIAVPAVNPYSTRSNPTGGEDGNGRERGVLNEDKIHDINVFFYKDPDGLDGAADTPILHHIYFNLDNQADAANSQLAEETKPEFEKSYLSIKFDIADKIAQLGEGTNFAAIANLGPIQDEAITTLGALRDLNITDYSNNTWNTYNPFSANAADMDYFLMSTAYNYPAYFDGEHTGSNKIEKDGRNFTGTTTVERLYARIDLWYNAQQNAGIDSNTEAGASKMTRLKYNVTDAEGNEVYIYNVLPVNVMRKPSYLFKKVTETKPQIAWTAASLKNLNQFYWGGKENTTEGTPSNYVIEPNTLAKTSAGAGDLTGWYSTSAAETVKTDIRSADKGKIESYFSKLQGAGTGDPAGYNCDRISIISYANENTHATDCFNSNYLTGLAFRAIYVPANVYEYSKPDGATAEKFTPVATGATLSLIYRFSPTHKPGQEGHNVKESESIYFASSQSCNAYKEAHPEITGETTTFTPFLHEGKWGFVCYYNLWLRHYNDESADPQETYPMEYATVRNNIYRVKVSFTGPGDNTPTLREPDTMKARIFVRKWNYREEDTFYFD